MCCATRTKPKTRCRRRSSRSGPGPSRTTPNGARSRSGSASSPAPGRSIACGACVPWDKFDELAQFDGSVSAVRTLGTLSARCDTVEHNILGLNLANDVALGKKTPEEARKAFEQAAMAEKKGEKPAILQRLMFEPMKMGTGDPDKSASMK